MVIFVSKIAPNICVPSEKSPFEMYIVAGDPVLIAPNDQFCLGMAATFLSAFREEKPLNWKALVYAPTVGPSRDQFGELIAITSKNCDYNVQPGLVIIDLFKDRDDGTHNTLQLWPRRGPSDSDGKLLSNGHPDGDWMHPGHLLDALDLANASALGVKYASGSSSVSLWRLLASSRNRLRNRREGTSTK